MKHIFFLIFISVGLFAQPATPTNLQVTKNNAESVTLTWDAQDGVDEFVVYYDTVSTNQTHSIKVDGSESSFRLDGLITGKSYFF